MKQPNFLIVMADHQRADTVLPEHPAHTPNLDRFVAEGVTFTDNHCPTPHCCPARATFFTGLYPSGHGIWNNVLNGQALATSLKPGVKLFSEDLRDAGYNLFYSGKWHVTATENPADRGWQEGHVNCCRGDHHGANWDHFKQLAGQPEPTDRGEGEILRPGYGTMTLYGTLDDDFPHGDTTTANDVIEALPRLAEGGKPWAAFCGFNGPHDPYETYQKYLDLYDLEDIPLPESYADELADKPRVYRRMRNMRFGQLSEREIREAIRHFRAYCSFLDDLFGRVLAALDATGQAENTVVLYCSDHGDYAGEHGLFAKGIPCFRGAYNVPAVVRWPAGLKNPGRRVEEFVSLADFAPTFLDLAGIDTDRHFTGQSLKPFLEDREPEQWRDAIFSQCNGVELYYTQRSVMTRDWKYVFNGFDMDELYDLRNDPQQMTNLADRPEHREVIRQMCHRMWQFAYEEGDTAVNPYITVSLAPFGPAEAFRD